ncbi:MAG: nuclear transport factor 2 family protein [Candidatus Cloacimonetes bacterium]|nr:nuclear transport factor 2 family protein [Candidatus Cloacimonadota bacterium]MCF7813712.1 nuclear transport factor 2 family protein [Candidatus Cloacimonadota bacterium]MCF7867778.1 nuclear transport factor 2 family protein [Candidatus Cloacimonadota bacterium]MCF7883244.1 nuclear transport factor 2 family protein [Candidatus Cloacimonadota bacterium]
MKKILPIILISFAIALGFIACDNQPEDIDGEVLVKEVWNAMKTGNIDYLDNVLDPAFQSIHADGTRNKADEIELVKGLNMGDFELTDFVITKNVNTMNVAYFVHVKETIEGETYDKKSARLSVFSRTPEGWKWISHANLLPMKHK